MTTNGAFNKCIERLGVALLDQKDVKAVMMARDDFGNVAITLVEGIEESRKVRFGVVERCSRILSRHQASVR